MKCRLELTDAEKAFLRRLDSQARLWRMFRWVGLAGGVTLIFGGGWNIFTAYRIALLRDLPPSLSLLMTTIGALTILFMGFILLTHIVARWRIDQRDRLLIRLLEASAAGPVDNLQQ